uniref:Uncharacterized protein n=1 Tax=Anguilla anguilla TaxID=7936 RepID=A0A0E9VIC4_ANGAN
MGNMFGVIALLQDEAPAEEVGEMSYYTARRNLLVHFRNQPTAAVLCYIINKDEWACFRSSHAG